MKAEGERCKQDLQQLSIHGQSTAWHLETNSIQNNLLLIRLRIPPFNRQDGLHMTHHDLPSTLLSLLPIRPRLRQQPRRLQHILDLPSIQLHLGQRVQLPLAQPRALAYKRLPDLPSARGVERRILHADVDAGVEGVVDVADAVCRQEENPLVVLEHAQEDADHLVALEVGRAARLEEDVCLVEEEHRVPFRDHFEDRRERLFDAGRVEPEVAGRHRVQGYAHVFRDGLGGERLADARGAGEQQDHAAAFALDDVVEFVLVLDLGFDEGLDQFLLVRGEDQAVEGDGIEGDWADVWEEEPEPGLGAGREAADVLDAEEELVFGQFAVFAVFGLGVGGVDEAFAVGVGVVLFVFIDVSLAIVI